MFLWTVFGYFASKIYVFKTDGISSRLFLHIDKECAYLAQRTNS